MSCANNGLWYRQTSAVKAGQVQRYEINYTPPPPEDGSPALRNFWVKIRNKEPLPMRAAFFAGPCLLYVDCTSGDYNANSKCFVSADQPKFESQLMPGKSFYCELSCHTIKDSYKWTVDVVSQILFNTSIEVGFEITIGTSKELLHEAAVSQQKVQNSNKTGTFVSSKVLKVDSFDTYDLWNLPVPRPQKPIHLVILTHGLHSNVSADMLYLKESIDKAKTQENLVVKGYFGNICKTERGIKYLGSRVAEYIVELVTKDETLNNGRVKKISFVGHSLGGLVQTFAIAYIASNFPWFFEKIAPVNFVCLASPMLGVSNENPIYVNLAMHAGIVGKTGQDLSLRFMDDYPYPLLLVLPTGPTHRILKTFVNRTVYANVVNDGVVSLRTAALLYLDYKGMSSVLSKEAMLNHHIDTKSSANKIPDDECTNTTYTSYLPQPLQALKTYFLPQKQVPPKSTETAPEDSEDQLEENRTMVKASEILGIEKLPKASMLDTISEILLPNLPSMKHITDPDSRENVIIYDKVYEGSDLLPKNDAAVEGEDALSKSISNSSFGDVLPEAQTVGIRHRIMSTFDFQEFERIEEEIARKYHKDMSWRKVLVKLKPDAHNNIVVRRRYANAYGWAVIDHLVQNHFENNEEVSPKSIWSNERGLGILENTSFGPDLTGILSRDLITKQNEKIDETSKKVAKEYHWINSKDNSESLFAVGPTGLLNDVGELFTSLRDQWYNGQTRMADSDSAVPEGIDKDYDQDLNVSSKQSMGDFI